MAKLLGMGGDVNGVPVTEWSANVSNDVQDVTDTGTGGWVARLSGVNSMDITFTAFWDTTAPLTSVFSIGSKVAFTLNIGDSGASITGSAIITSFTVTNGAKTPVQFQCTAQSDDEVTFP